MSMPGNKVPGDKVLGDKVPGDTASRHVREARAHMALAPGFAYLNTGAFGPLPRTVADTVAAFRQHLAQDPMDFLLRQAPALLWTARTRLATFLHGDPRSLLLTNNVTEAVNLVANSLPLAAPGEILVSDHEYTTMRWCWDGAAQQRGLNVRIFPVPVHPESPGQLLDCLLATLRSLLTPQTRLIFFSHIISATGLILPARAICAFARRHGVLSVVDGAHGPGFMPLDLADLGCDYYIGSGHKWLLAPSGTGFLYAGAGAAALARLQPAHVSWGFHLPAATGTPGGIPDYLAGASTNRAADALANTPDRFGSTPALRRLECTGTRDICPWLAVPAALDFIDGYGHNATLARVRELAAYARTRLRALPALVPLTPAHAELSGGMTAFALPASTDATALQANLWQRHRIEVGMAQHGDQPLIRISTHFFNSESEIDLLADVLSADFTK